jgi:hypothetical protein
MAHPATGTARALQVVVVLNDAALVPVIEMAETSKLPGPVFVNVTV